MMEQRVIDRQILDKLEHMENLEEILKGRDEEIAMAFELLDRRDRAILMLENALKSFPENIKCAVTLEWAMEVSEWDEEVRQPALRDRPPTLAASDYVKGSSSSVDQKSS